MHCNDDHALQTIFRDPRERRKQHVWPALLANELLDAYNGEGKVMKRKQDLYRQCEANRAYAHYRTLR